MSTPKDPYCYDPYGQPPSYPAQPYPAYQPYPCYPPPQGLQDPDQAMGIVGLILSVLVFLWGVPEWKKMLDGLSVEELRELNALLRKAFHTIESRRDS